MNKKLNISRWIGAVVLLAAFGAGAGAGWWTARQNSDNGDAPNSSAENATPPSAQAIHALGRIEPMGGFIHINGPMGDRILKLHASEKTANASPQLFNKGDKLVTLESYSLGELEVQTAEKQLGQAEIQRAAIEEAADLEIRTAKDQLVQAKKTEKRMLVQIESSKRSIDSLATAHRLAQEILQTLRSTGVSAQSVEYKRQQLAVAESLSALETARGKMSALEQEKEVVVKKAKLQVELAEKMKTQRLAAIPIGTFEAAVEAAKRKRDLSIITCPVDNAQVLQTIGRVGDPVIATQPIMVLGNIQQLRCTAEVSQTDVDRIELDQPVVMESKAYEQPGNDNGRINGIVKKKGRMIHQPAVMSPNPVLAQDRRVIEVEILIDDEEEKVAMARRLLGMQVDVEFPSDAKRDQTSDPTSDQNADADPDAKPAE